MKKKNSTTTIRKAFNSWWRNKEEASNDMALKSFYDTWLDPLIGNTKVGDIDKEFAKGINKRFEKRYTKAKGKPPSKALVKYVALCLRRALEDETPYYTLIKPPTSEIKEIFNPQDKLKKVYDSIMQIEDEDFKIIFLFLFFGRRKGEVLGLKPENIFLKDGIYKIENVKNGDEFQVYYLPPELSALLCDFRGFSHITNYQFYKALKELKIASGVDINSHKYRTITTITALKNGADIHTVRSNLGHRHTVDGALRHYSMSSDRISESREVYGLIKAKLI